MLLNPRGTSYLFVYGLILVSTLHIFPFDRSGLVLEVIFSCLISIVVDLVSSRPGSVIIGTCPVLVLALASSKSDIFVKSHKTTTFRNAIIPNRND